MDTFNAILVILYIVVFEKNQSKQENLSLRITLSIMLYNVKKGNVGNFCSEASIDNTVLSTVLLEVLTNRRA